MMSKHICSLGIFIFYNLFTNETGRKTLYLLILRNFKHIDVLNYSTKKVL